MLVSVLLCICLRRCIIGLITGVLWSLLLLLLSLGMVHVSAQLVHPVLEVCLPFLVDTHLELHLVCLRHSHLSALHFVGLQMWQVVEEPVVVAEDFYALRVQPVLWPHVAVRLLEDGAAPVEAPEQLEEPVLVCTLLSDNLHQGSHGPQCLFCPVFVVLQAVHCYIYVINEHDIGGRVWDALADLDVFLLGHEYLVIADLRHELDADNGLLVRGHDKSVQRHCVIKVFLAADIFSDLFARQIFVWRWLHSLSAHATVRQ